MTKNNPLVSVIVPVYNTAKFLPTCLNSILNQTYQNLEIIIINDGSTDDSEETISKYATKDDRIKTISQENQGLSGARNAGIKTATGDYITFVDSDDKIEPTMIEKLLLALKQTDSDIAVCSFKELYKNGKVVHFNKNDLPETIYHTDQALKAMLKEQGFMVSATMKLFPTSYFKNIKFPLNKLHEDVGTTYKLIMKAGKTVFIPNELYIYIHHGKSIISQQFDDRKFDLITLTDEMCDNIDKKYPNLKNVTNERRIRARFSILRQIPSRHPKTKQITNYLKKHQNYITKNPEATLTDKIALKLALTSPKLFKLAYKLFK